MMDNKIGVDDSLNDYIVYLNKLPWKDVIIIPYLGLKYQEVSDKKLKNALEYPTA
jgi:hypothetical protein